MNDRILVYMMFGAECISLRTVTRSGKSPHRFFISYSSFAELDQRSEVIVHDIGSFAVLRRDPYAETVEIELTWLLGDGQNVSGYRETIILPYAKLAAFLQESSAEDKTITWKTLSIDNSGKRPQLLFKSRENLHHAIMNGVVRRKLVRCLRDAFRWPCCERVEFYDDFVPYSFNFREIRGGKPAITGGLILHGQEEMEHASYSVHT